MLLVALAAAVALDAVCWAAFRIDKARARRGAWRLRERTLLGLALVGGPGALVGMYAHRRRHKTRHARFVAVAMLGVVVQVAAVTVVAVGRFW